MSIHAAALRSSRFQPYAVGLHRVAGSLLAIVFLLGSGTASALEGIDLSAPSEPVAEGECPRLIQIKYPFLSCSNGQIGQSVVDETWENSRRLPRQSDWAEGNAHFGPTLHAD